MMKDELISFETAVLADQKGFNEECNRFFTRSISGKNIGGGYCGYTLIKKNNEILRPTQSLLQRWLREKHNIDLWFGMTNYPNKYHVEDIIKDNMIIGGINVGSPTYEEALELGLQEALKLIP